MPRGEQAREMRQLSCLRGDGRRGGEHVLRLTCEGLRWGVELPLRKGSGVEQGAARGCSLGCQVPCEPKQEVLHTQHSALQHQGVLGPPPLLNHPPRYSRSFRTSQPTSFSAPIASSFV